MTDKDRKLAEKLFEEYIGEGLYGIDFEKKHIIEFAEAYHEARMKEVTEPYPYNWTNSIDDTVNKEWHVPDKNDIFEILKHLITDEDIERQVKQINRREALCTVDYYSTGFIEGAKAMRDGKIKHKEE